MAVLCLGPNYFVDSAQEKHLCLIHAHAILFLAHTLSLPESFRYQLKHGRKKKKLLVSQHTGLVCDFSLGDSVLIFLSEASIPPS